MRRTLNCVVYSRRESLQGVDRPGGREHVAGTVSDAGRRSHVVAEAALLLLHAPQQSGGGQAQGPVLGLGRQIESAPLVPFVGGELEKISRGRLCPRHLGSKV